jgi:hypothetical protein
MRHATVTGRGNVPAQPFPAGPGKGGVLTQVCRDVDGVGQPELLTW